MNNKVLVKLLVPELDCKFDLFIPVNEVVWKVIKLITKSVIDLSGVELDSTPYFILINKTTGESYDNNAVIIDTDIRNATELVLISVKNTNNIIEMTIPEPASKV